MDTFALLSRSTKLRKPTDKSAALGTAKQAPNDEDRATKKRKRQHELDGKTTIVPTVSVAVTDDFTEDESRRVLRSHKLKATLLWRPEADEASNTRNTTKKRRSKTSSEAASSPLKKRKEEVVPQPVTSFSQLRSRYQLPDSLLLNLDAQGFRSPTEVQTGSLPLLLDAQTSALRSNKPHEDFPVCNLMTVAPTGSGKTLAFLIPMVASIIRRRRARQEDAAPGPLAVIVAPTKELARQIVNESRKLCAKTGIRTTLVRRGVTLYGSAARKSDQDGDEDSDEASLSDDQDSSSHAASVLVKSQILVGTPMAMVHAATSPEGRKATLPTVQNLVLDEADVLLDPLFRDQTMQIWEACSSASLRVSLWSATVGSSIEELATKTLKERYEDSVNATAPAPFIRLVVGLKDSSIPNIEHRLVYAASEQGKLMGMRQLLHTPGTSKDGTVLRPPFLVFTQTILRATALHSELLYDIPAEAGGSSRIAVLHSDLSETARDGVMTRLRKGEIWVLITTDLLARGIDFAGINGVVNYDLPTSSAAYVHRAGRTGRAGREGGVAVTLYSKDDLPFVKNIANVVAASERVKGGDEAAAAKRKWLLESLPKVTKKDKQQLKRRGVESRRGVQGKDGDSEDKTKNSRSQISTKGGFLRRVENKRKGAIEGSKRRVAAAASAADIGDGDSDGAGSSDA